MKPSEKPCPGSAAGRADLLDFWRELVGLDPIHRLEPLFGWFRAHCDGYVGMNPAAV
jgi:hypothetical protein